MPKVMMTEAQRRAERYRKENEEIKGRIGAYMMVSGKTLAQVGAMAGIRQSTMYERMKDPGTLRLDEYRRLMDVVGRD